MTTPQQLPMGLEAAHNNQYLFSDHYLDHLLRADPRWDEARPQAEAFLAWLAGLYERESEHLPHYSEAQLEEHWIKPILARLGHIYEPQAAIPGLHGSGRRPDYVFFPTEAERQAAVTAQNSDDYATHALAVGDAKRWDIALGKKIKGGDDSFQYQNPSYQIDTYLRSTGLPWGILTNGQKWRLVHRQSSYRLTTYYEIDLIRLLALDDAGLLPYFTLFFRQAAFRPDAQGRRFLDDALAESRAYAIALEEDLRDNVYQALEKLIQGFLDLPGNGLGPDDLPAIYENSLILLYRLIFILYGESRGLLPMQNSTYRRQYSLRRIKKQFADLQQQDRLPAPMTGIHWGDIRQLFQIINGDNADLNQYLGVPRYNGGLFDPGQHPFLERYAVGDRALVEAINLLSLRRSDAGQLEFVDYRTLGVRQLGSIYEGLLEYRPRLATSPLVAIRDKKSREGRWVARAKAPQSGTILEARAAGQVYLETDRGERKATGSYYTPQYIVEYIVENTLGPLVEQARQRVKARAAAAPAAERAAAEQSFVDEILSLKVLDPAMGSGHFLVEATDYLALALATDAYVDTAGDPTEEDKTIWKRRVVERCIYGVDKNPLAVELAKLSLWLSTVAAEKPLSFLDHHLKCGDALVGARVADLGEAPPLLLSKKQQQERQKLAELGMRQANLFEQRLGEMLPVVLGKILEITRTESDSYDTVQAKEAADQAVAGLKAPFEAAAHLWVSAYFGHGFNQGDYDAALDKLSKPGDLHALPPVQQAQTIAAQRRFFHWELAFPEVFYDENGQPLGDKAGFDAVVGNPPWRGRVEKTFYEYLKEKFSSLHQRLPDMAKYFFGFAHSIRGKSGYIGQIVPNVFLYQHEYTKLRQLLLENYDVKDLINLGDNVFQDVTAPCCIIIAQENRMADETPTNIWDLRHISRESLSEWQVERPISFTQKELKNIPDFVVIGDSVGVQLLGRLYEISNKVIDLAESISLGVHSGANSAFIMTPEEATRKKIETNVIWPLLTGSDIDRYHTTKEPENVILFVDWDFDAEKHPNTIAHLSDFKEQLSSRREAKQGKMPWYALHWPRYLGLYDSPKVMCRQTADTLIATVDPYGHCALNSTIIIRPDSEEWSPYFWSALLNSSVLRYVYNILAQEEERTFAEVKPVNLRKLPIRRIEFTTPAVEREQLVAQAQMLYQAAAGQEEDLTGFENLSGLNLSGLNPSGLDSLLAFTQARLDVRPEQADVVHDLLAYLAGQMIDLNKEKQQRTEAFWLDLEGVTDPDTFPKLRDKGKWEATLWKQAACLPYVDEESRSTVTLDASLGWDEAAFKAFVKALAGSVPHLSDLVQLYRRHHAPYRQLTRQLAATDRLIDRIVYQLYGLTEEEIAIVEG